MGSNPTSVTMSEGRSAGRPKGSKNSSNILKLRSFVNKREIERFVELAKKKAQEDPQLLKFMLEQIFGKAPQTVDMNVAPQQRSFQELENNLKMLNTKNDTIIEATFVNEQGTGAALIQAGEREGTSDNPDPGTDIQSDMAAAKSESPRDVPHEIREVIHNSVSGADQNSDLPREVGDSSTIGKEGKDNHELPN